MADLFLKFTFYQDGDCSIPTQELGTAMRALGTFPRETEMLELADMAMEVSPSVEHSTNVHFMIINVQVSFEQFLLLLHRQKEAEKENETQIKDTFGVREYCALPA